MSNSSSSSSSGIGLSGVVFLIFLVLKLAKIGQVATWSWWWVTAPLWGGLVLALVVFIIAIPFIAYREHKKRNRVQSILDKYKR